MPTYEYRCDACRREFDVEQRISDPPGAGCPHCGSLETRRLISLSSFVLKGSGWYVTDYGRGGSNGAKDEKPGPAKTESSSSPAPAKT